MRNGPPPRHPPSVRVHKPKSVHWHGPFRTAFLTSMAFVSRPSSVPQRAHPVSDGSPSERPEGHAEQPGIPVVQIGSDHLQAGAARLMADQHPDPYHAGDRFLQAARMLNLDLRWFWGVPADPSGSESGEFRQVLLAVPGSGRTAMLFLSPPPHPRGLWRPSPRSVASSKGAPTGSVMTEPHRALLERRTLLDAAARRLAQPDAGVVLGQALLEPPSQALVEAFLAAGFQRLGDLAYYRKAFARTALSSETPAGPEWPAGVRVVSLAELEPAHDRSSIDGLLAAALERSYVDTLDCPELCGMRTLADVLESHRSVGQFEPRLWWVVTIDGRPAGCAMFSPVRETDTVELVYLGLGPELRGKRLGRALMVRALNELGRLVETARPSDPLHGMALAGGITLAVDTRNTPAARLYRSLGFTRTGVRIPLVRSLSA